MKTSLVLLTAVFFFCQDGGQAVYLVSPNVGQLIKTEQPQQFLKHTTLKFYNLKMDLDFWTSYETLTRNCLKMNSFRTTASQITIACLQRTY